DIWQAASTAETPAEGWLGKALRGMPAAPSFHLKGSSERAPLALDGAPARVPSIASLNDFQLQVAAATGADRKARRDGTGRAVHARGGGGVLASGRRGAGNPCASGRRLREIGKNYQPRAPPPPPPLAERLKRAPQLIDGGFGARLFYVALDGFDTH